MKKRAIVLLIIPMFFVTACSTKEVENKTNNNNQNINSSNQTVDEIFLDNSYLKDVNESEVLTKENAENSINNNSGLDNNIIDANEYSYYNDDKLVYNHENQYYIVWFYKGETITGLEWHFHMPDVDKANSFKEVLESGNHKIKNIDNIFIQNNIVIIRMAENDYANYTTSKVKEMHSMLEKIDEYDVVNFTGEYTNTENSSNLNKGQSDDYITINSSNLNEGQSDDYITINSLNLNKEIRFKTNNPTCFWNSKDDFGAFEIDTFFIVSKNGVPVENYYEIERLSGISFLQEGRYFGSHNSVKKLLSNWHGISDIKITELKDSIFSRHIKGETNGFYLEIYCMEYNGISYAIELNVYKNDYTQNEIDNIILEYNTIISTLEIL